MIKLPSLDATSNITDYQNRNLWLATVAVAVTAVLAGIGLSAFGGLGQYAILGTLSLAVTLVIAFKRPFNFFFLFLIFMPVNVYLLTFSEISVGPFNLIGGIKDLLLFILTAGVIATALSNRRQFVVQDGLSILVVVYLAWAMFQTLRSDLFVGLIGFRIVAQFVLAYLIVKFIIKDIQQARSLLLAIVLGGVFVLVVGLDGLDQLSWLSLGLANPGARGRLAGVFPQVNMYGTYLGIVFSLGILFVLQNNTLKNRTLIFIFELTTLMLLILTFSRRAWIAVIVAVFIWIFIRFRLTDLLKIGLLVVLSYSAFVFVDNQIITETSVVNAIIYRLDLTTHEGMISAGHRIDELGYYREVITGNVSTFFLGEGLGTYGTGRRTIVGGGTLHNSYLVIWLEMGLVGLGLFLSIIGITLYRGIRVVRSNSKWNMVVGASVAALVVILTSSLFGDMIGNYPFNFFLWFSIGLINVGFTDFIKEPHVKAH